MESSQRVHNRVALVASGAFFLFVGGGIWQASAYAPPPVHAPLHRAEDPRLGAVVKAALPHPREPFLLVDLGCGCEIVHIDPILLARRYGGLPLVFAVADPRDLPSGIERTDPETLRTALNPWFTPRVYGFATGGHLAYIQSLPDLRHGIAQPLEEARRALEVR